MELDIRQIKIKQKKQRTIPYVHTYLDKPATKITKLIILSKFWEQILPGSGKIAIILT